MKSKWKPWFCYFRKTALCSWLLGFNHNTSDPLECNTHKGECLAACVISSQIDNPVVSLVN